MSTILNKPLMLIIGWVITILPTVALAQTEILTGYIKYAFENNETLEQKQFQLEKALFALKEAHALFLPNVSFIGNYTKAGGGRTIDFPVGDMLNPVYATLNELTASTEFPQLDNASILLNPDNFYDAKFRTALPLINAELWYHQKIKKEIITQQEAAVNVYKRQLVLAIKTAYFHCFQAQKRVEIYENALKFIEENIRVNESLFKNGVKNNTALTRSLTEKQKITASLNEAKNMKSNANAYFNFLINQPSDSPIQLDTEFDEPDENPGYEVPTANREELVQLKAAHQAYQYSQSIQKAHLIPKVSTFLDVGSQGFDWEMDSQSQYYLWGVNLQWDLFGANKFKYQAKQTEADIKTIDSKIRETERALALQVEQAYNNYNTAYFNYSNAQSQLTLSERYYADQSKLYKAGQLLYIELLDAQNQITEAELRMALSSAQIHIALAELEHSLASFPL